MGSDPIHVVADKALVWSIVAIAGAYWSLFWVYIHFRFKKLDANTETLWKHVDGIKESLSSRVTNEACSARHQVALSEMREALKPLAVALNYLKNGGAIDTLRDRVTKIELQMESLKGERP